MLWFETHFECIDLVVLISLSAFEPPPNHQTALGAGQRLLKVTGQILQTSVEVLDTSGYIWALKLKRELCFNEGKSSGERCWTTHWKKYEC